MNGEFANEPPEPAANHLTGLSQFVDRVATSAARRRRSNVHVPVDEPTTPDCDVCDGRGLYLDDGELTHCACADTPERKARMHHALLQYGRLDGAAMKGMTFDNFDTTGSRYELAPELSAARHWAREPEGFLYIAGDEGTGKTHLAVAVARERIGLGDVVYYSTVADLMDTLRANSFGNDGDYYRIMDSLMAVDLLILDDLGRERRNAFSDEKLHQVIVGRERARMPTVVATILNEEDLAKQRPDLASRLLSQYGYGSVGLVLDVPDYRKGG